MFNDKLRATQVEPASQSHELGIRSGWRARSICDTVLEAIGDLVAKIGELKKAGFSNAALAFSPPALCVTFDERPLGLVIKHDDEFWLIVATEVREPALGKGIRPGAVLVRVEHPHPTPPGGGGGGPHPKNHK